MKILFLHGWHSVPGGVKPTYLADHGHAVLNLAENQPNVIVGSSRGGAVAMNIDSGDTPLVLLCPAWKNWGTAKTLKRQPFAHGQIDVVPFATEDCLDFILSAIAFVVLVCMLLPR